MFLSTNFGSKTGLSESGDSNDSCCALAVICAFCNYFQTNSVFYFRINCIDDVFICVNFAQKKTLVASFR